MHTNHSSGILLRLETLIHIYGTEQNEKQTNNILLYDKAV